MASIIAGLSVFVFGQVVAGLVWGLRLEGKVKVQEQYTTDLKELIITKLDGIDRRLIRIESSMNGKLRHD
jgi:hypothetical protein